MDCWLHQHGLNSSAKSSNISPRYPWRALGTSTATFDSVGVEAQHGSVNASHLFTAQFGDGGIWGFRFPMFYPSLVIFFGWLRSVPMYCSPSTKKNSHYTPLQINMEPENGLPQKIPLTNGGFGGCQQMCPGPAPRVRPWAAPSQRGSDKAKPRPGWVRCGAVRCGAVRCGGVVWCGVVWCVVWCGVVWCGVVWCGVGWGGVGWGGVGWGGGGVGWGGGLNCPKILSQAFFGQEQLGQRTKFRKTRSNCFHGFRGFSQGMGVSLFCSKNTWRKVRYVTCGPGFVAVLLRLPFWGGEIWDTKRKTTITGVQLPILTHVWENPSNCA